MTVLIEERPSDGVVLLRLNRPDVHNALNTELRRVLAQRFSALSADTTTRCIVLTGNTKTFAAGADLKEIADDTSVDIAARNIMALWKPITDCQKPIIAAVNGVALGAGCELALHADIIICGKSATFAQLELGVGLMPGGGATQRLVRAIGKYQTMMMVLTGEPVSGERAAAMGLASEVVDDDDVVDRAIRLAQKIAAMPPVAVRLAKEAVVSGAEMSLSAGLLFERRLFESNFSTQDKQEGIAAFIEKRPPRYTGK
jgi:enoyl-CoA hydratase